MLVPIRNYIDPHDDVIKWRNFPRYWPFARGIHRSPMNSPHKGQWRRALIFFKLRLNKRLGKQSWGWWSETPSRSLWRHYNVSHMLAHILIVVIPEGIHILYIDYSAPSRWRHQMELLSALLALCAGNSPVTGEFPAQRPVARSFDVFFDLRLHRPLS